jgi:hypothetical protein
MIAWKNVFYGRTHKSMTCGRPQLGNQAVRRGPAIVEVQRPSRLRSAMPHRKGFTQQKRHERPRDRTGSLSSTMR